MWGQVEHLLHVLTMADFSNPQTNQQSNKQTKQNKQTNKNKKKNKTKKNKKTKNKQKKNKKQKQKQTKKRKNKTFPITPLPIQVLIEYTSLFK